MANIVKLTESKITYRYPRYWSFWRPGPNVLNSFGHITN